MPSVAAAVGHGDALPPSLEALVPPNLYGLPRGVQRSAITRTSAQRRAAEAVHSLNELPAGPGLRANATLGFADRSVHLGAQRAAVDSIRQRVDLYGPEPDQQTDAEALRELLRADALYGDGSFRVAPYLEEVFRFCRSDIVPRPVVGLAPSVVADAFRDADHFIRRPDANFEEADAEPIKPYHDRTLATAAKERRRFIAKCVSRGFAVASAADPLWGGGFRRIERSGYALSSTRERRAAPAIAALTPRWVRQRPCASFITANLAHKRGMGGRN